MIIISRPNILVCLVVVVVVTIKMAMTYTFKRLLSMSL